MNTHRSFRLTPSAGPITKLILKVGFIRILVVLLLAAAWGSYLAWDYDQTHGKKKAQHINCVNNLKQLGLAFRIWSGDNKDRYPCNVSTNDGGTMELCARDQDGFDRNGFLSLQVMSNELSVTMILVCPQDKGRHWATNFGSLRPENVSYRIRSGKNIDEINPGEILAVCPVDGNILYCDGSVKVKGAKAGTGF